MPLEAGILMCPFPNISVTSRLPNIIARPNSEEHWFKEKKMFVCAWLILLIRVGWEDVLKKH